MGDTEGSGVEDGGGNSRNHDDDDDDDVDDDAPSPTTRRKEDPLTEPLLGILFPKEEEEESDPESSSSSAASYFNGLKGRYAWKTIIVKGSDDLSSPSSPSFPPSFPPLPTTTTTTTPTIPISTVRESLVMDLIHLLNSYFLSPSFRDVLGLGPSHAHPLLTPYVLFPLGGGKGAIVEVVEEDGRRCRTVDEIKGGMRGIRDEVERREGERRAEARAEKARVARGAQGLNNPQTTTRRTSGPEERARMEREREREREVRRRLGMSPSGTRTPGIDSFFDLL